jgi:sugar phosphate isomerase/epimerase
MKPCQILPSTTSHKREPLGVTLEIFSRLGMLDLDLNLHHIIEDGVPIDDVRSALVAGQQRVWVVSGGWCDFYHEPPQIDETFRSVERQVATAKALGVDRIRLFFGRLKLQDYSRESLVIISTNLRRLSDRHPGMLFAFENHDGASLRPAICREILETVDRSNIRMNFDPVNFERAGVSGLEALRELSPLISHVHLKGSQGTACCEFGVGDVDLTPVLEELVRSGYQGGFTVEYEGRFDRTVRLYQSFRRAQSTIEAVIGARS